MPTWMISLLALLIAADDGPRLAEVWPPGATVGADTPLTFTGRHLDRTTAAVVADGDGLQIVDLRPDGPDRVIGVARVAPDARPGVREVRLDGPTGATESRPVRIDALTQFDEANLPGRTVAVGSVVAGRLAGSERDRYAITGPPGHRVRVELEVGRVGFAFAPVVTATTAEGRALGQARGPDPQLDLTVPPDGRFRVEVRDNLDRGGPHAGYRLRVVPVAREDPSPPPDPGPIALEPGREAGGTIPAPGRVARFRLPAPAGSSVVVRVDALPDSPLDPVVTVRDAAGAVVAEGDDTDRVVPGQPAPVRSRDARVRVGPLPRPGVTIEVADRFGHGGPDFAFRVAAGPPAGDFRLAVAAGPTGVIPAQPGSEVRVDVAVVPEGLAGPVEVRAVGLPPGVRADPVPVRGPGPFTAAPVWLEVDPAAAPGLYPIAFEGTAGAVRRRGEATVDGWAGPPSTRTVDRVWLRVLGP